MVAAANGASPQTGEIAAGIGLRIALAPQLVGAEDARQVPPLLLFGPPVNKRRAQQVQRARRRQNRRTGGKIFLVEDHLLHKAGAPAAIFLGPGDPDPAGGVHCLLPCNALFERLPVRCDPLISGIVDADLSRQVTFEPAPELGTECGVLGAAGEIHGGSFY
jgi:hypothetical protein